MIIPVSSEIVIGCLGCLYYRTERQVCNVVKKIVFLFLKGRRHGCKTDKIVCLGENKIGADSDTSISLVSIQ